MQQAKTGECVQGEQLGKQEISCHAGRTAERVHITSSPYPSFPSHPTVLEGCIPFMPKAVQAPLDVLLRPLSSEVL
jgi:hypothetical protein